MANLAESRASARRQLADGHLVYVADVDATVARAVANGAKVLVPLQNQFWGDRIAWLSDPAGHVWTVASRVEDTSAAERTARWDKIVSGKQ